MKFELKEIFNIIEKNKGAEIYQKIIRKRYKETYLEERKDVSEQFARFYAEIRAVSYAEGYMAGCVMGTVKAFSILKSEIEGCEEIYCKRYSIDKETLQEILEFGNQLIKEEE